MANNTKQSLNIDNLVPVMAAAAINGAAGGSDDILRNLLIELAGEALAEKKKRKEQLERLAMQGVIAAKEAEAAKQAQWRGCSHTKQDGETRLRGQYISGTGQLSLVCLFCGKDFFYPPNPGQEAPPRHLVPPAEVIGG